MVHKTSILPGLSTFIDQAVLSQYAPTSFKRIAAAGAIALYLKQNSNIVDIILNNPIVSALHVSTDDGMVNIDTLRMVYKEEIRKAGFMRINFPILGNVDFTENDIDTLYQLIMSVSNTPNQIQ
jgi:hypothetical protein